MLNYYGGKREVVVGFVPQFHVWDGVDTGCWLRCPYVVQVQPFVFSTSLNSQSLGLS